MDVEPSASDNKTAEEKAKTDTKAMREQLNKLREVRLAKQQARLEKLRTMNLKKYNNEVMKTNTSSTSLQNRPSLIPTKVQDRPKNYNIGKSDPEERTNDVIKAATSKTNVKTNYKPVPTKKLPFQSTVNKTAGITEKRNLPIPNTIKHVTDLKPCKNATSNGTVKDTTMTNSDFVIPRITVSKYTQQKKLASKPAEPAAGLSKSAPLKKIEPKASLLNSRKSISHQPTKDSTQNLKKTIQTPSKVSVFERLSKPKCVTDKHVPKPVVHHKTSIYKQKALLANALALNRQSLAPRESQKEVIQNVRRSMSAVHFKRITKKELTACNKKWSSIGDNLDKVTMQDIQEDHAVTNDVIISSAIKSERKKSVTFRKVMSFMNVNTPKADELQRRLTSWLQKRGKSVDSYHHLQCFGMHHLAKAEREDELRPFDDEDKENIEIADNASHTDIINDRNDDFEAETKWRRVSSNSDSLDLNETPNAQDMTTFTEDVNTPKVHLVEDLLVGALTDLAELVQEGFDWEQCARWLRAIRERFPGAPETAAYWECRAALEERQGNFPGSCQCWEEAIAKGTATSVAEASLDQLLDKFMQLNISPNGGKQRTADSKLLDIKNVIKSTLIRFAVQKAKWIQSEKPKYTATPVRRSSRLSQYEGSKVGTPDVKTKGTPLKSAGKKRTPLVQLCSSLKQIDEDVRSCLVFVPNKTLEFSP